MERKKTTQASQHLLPLEKFPQEQAREAVRKGIEAREALLQQIEPIRTMTREQIEILMAEIPELTFEEKNGKTYVGSYELKEELGKGGCGIVYKVWDHDLDREAVLKEIKPGISDENEVLQFIRELRTMSKLKHRHVVDIYMAGKKKDKTGKPSNPFFVMEKCEGDAISKKKALSEMTGMEKLNWAETNMVGLAEALQLAHEKGFVHGDVKPSNILIQGNDWKLSDFGYAHNFLHSPEDYEDNYGTPVYMAPEYIAAQPNKLTPQTDYYAFAMSMFEILTRTQLFGDVKPREIMIYMGRMYYEKKFPPKAQERILRNMRENTSKHLGECLFKMIQPDPEQRIHPSKVVQSLRDAIRKDKEYFKNLKAPIGLDDVSSQGVSTPIKVTESQREDIRKGKEPLKDMQAPVGLEDVPLQFGTEALVTIQGKNIQIRGRVTMGKIEHEKMVKDGLLPPLRFITLDDVDVSRLEDALGLKKQKYELLFDEMSHELICRRKKQNDIILKMEINKFLAPENIQQKQRMAS
jgi:serine/threonine protein kinase